MGNDNASLLASFFTHTEYNARGFDLNRYGRSYAKELSGKINAMFTIQAMNLKTKTICWGKYTEPTVNITDW